MRTLLMALFAAFCLATTATSSLAADDRDFTVVNKTGYTIRFIGVNAPGDNNFNENELNGLMAEGSTVDIKFGKGDKGCNWNMVIAWEGYNDAVIFKDMDLCKISKVTLRYDGATKVTSYVWE